MEFAPGERPAVPKDSDVLSVAETTDSGMVRWYWLFPEEFPDVYRKREDRDEAAQRVVSELRAIVQDN